MAISNGEALENLKKQEQELRNNLDNLQQTYLKVLGAIEVLSQLEPESDLEPVADVEE